MQLSSLSGPMESEENKWLKRVFRETEYCSDSPQPKRIKFSDIATELHAQFPGHVFSPYEVSQLVHEVFPRAESKACGKSRQKHIRGLERIPQTSTCCPSELLRHSLVLQTLVPTLISS